MKNELGITGSVVMYVGNLEPYQGIDLLLESFTLVLDEIDHVHLVIIGGETRDIHKYKRRVLQLGIQKRVYLLGPRPVGELGRYLSEADILVSPRLRGSNTPMKLYSYLHSGKPVVATKLPTHTQVVDEYVACLAEPHKEAFADAMLGLIKNQERQAELGAAGKQLVEKNFTYGDFTRKLNELFDQLQLDLQEKGVRLP